MGGFVLISDSPAPVPRPHFKSHQCPEGFDCSLQTRNRWNAYHHKVIGLASLHITEDDIRGKGGRFIIQPLTSAMLVSYNANSGDVHMLVGSQIVLFMQG